MNGTIVRNVAAVLAVALLSVPGAVSGESGGAADAGAADGAAAAETAADSTAERTEPLTEAAKEDTIHGGWLVLASYIVLWLLVLAYVVHLGLRQRRLSAEIDDLESRIDETLAGSAEED